MTKKVVLPPQEGKPSDVEEVKAASNYLRGTLAESMQDELTAGIPDWDNKLLKFHGSYLQDDRDQRVERERKNWNRLINLWCVSVCRPGLRHRSSGSNWMNWRTNTETVQ